VYPSKDPPSQPAISAMLVGNYGDDGRLLHNLFRSAGWALLHAGNPRHAAASLRNNHVQIVLSGTGGKSWTWKGLLHDLRKLTPPPVLIVTSRTADEYLWAEVLNLGGFDVLAQPFDPNEVERVLVAARRRFEPALPRATSTGGLVPYAVA